MIFLYGILCLAVVMVLFTFRISNRIILAGYLTGICYRWMTDGWIGTGRGILEAAVFFLLLIPVYRFGAFGGGDIKLFSVCALFTGIMHSISIFIYACFAGAFISIFVLAYRLIFKKTRKKAVIHFSIPILFGVIALQTGGSIL